MIVGFARSDLDVVVRRKHNALHRGAARGSSLKLFELTFDLVHIGGFVQSLEKALGESPLAAA